MFVELILRKNIYGNWSLNSSKLIRRFAGDFEIETPSDCQELDQKQLSIQTYTWSPQQLQGGENRNTDHCSNPNLIWKTVQVQDELAKFF